MLCLFILSYIIIVSIHNLLLSSSFIYILIYILYILFLIIITKILHNNIIIILNQLFIFINAILLLIYYFKICHIIINLLHLKIILRYSLYLQNLLLLSILHTIIFKCLCTFFFIFKHYVTLCFLLMYHLNTIHIFH